MKWFSIAALCALVIVITACEKHPASQLPPELRGEAKHGEGQHAAKPETAPAEHAAEPAKPAAEAKPGEAPKFFPENK